MGFSGGGSNTLKPHKHSSAVQDGSPLNMVNVTEGSLNAGDMVFSDGNALQRLAVGLAAQQLKVNAGATAPEWFTPVAGGASTAQYIQTSGHFTTNSVVLVDITNYSITLPTTTAASDDCLCLLSYAVTISGGSDAILMALTKDTTVLINQTTAPPVLDENTVGAFQFITDSDGDTLKAQTSTAGGNTMTFRIYAGNNPCLSAFAV
ncbi:uncharacterized protein METZ01_LOCUS371513 [marine metagenome]|uniref:Uncharacterized protein n=1 Tax=marine metagenome TaxID=408172 RepID=A0A382T941_9ZZZZ